MPRRTIWLSWLFPFFATVFGRLTCSPRVDGALWGQVKHVVYCNDGNLRCYPSGTQPSPLAPGGLRRNGFAVGPTTETRRFSFKKVCRSVVTFFTFERAQMDAKAQVS